MESYTAAFVGLEVGSQLFNVAGSDMMTPQSMIFERYGLAIVAGGKNL